MKRLQAIAGLLAALALLAGSLPAAEIRLRSEASCAGPVVTLGDVAEVVAGDVEQAQTLAAVELAPTPPPGTERYLRFREVQDRLLARGVNLAEHQFSGYAQTRLVARPAARAEAPKPLQATAIEKARRQVAEAIAEHLRQTAASGEAWTAAVRLDDVQARLVAGGSGVTVRGGQAPWTGPQRFVVNVATAQGTQAFAVEAEVGVQAAVVVARRSIARGAAVRADDVELASDPSGLAPGQPFRAIEEVLGKETTRAIPVGEVLDAASLRAPLVVRRGEVVTVHARHGGVRVRTIARAKDDGALGQTVTVESTLDRKTYAARVCGLQEVEVEVGAVVR